MEPSLTCQPMFSVIMPLYQVEAYVLRSLESVGRQTFSDWELLVVDNGSRDRSLELAREWARNNPRYRCRLLSEPRRGPGAARNAGIKAASGDWIAFLDADDVWYPEKLRVVAGVIAAHGTCDLVCHDELAVPTAGATRVLEHHKRYYPDRPLFAQLFTGNFLSPSAVSVTKTSLLRTGLFDVTLPCYEDHDLWIRLARFATPVFVPQVLGEYTERDGSAIRDIPRALACDLHVGRKHFREFARYATFPHLIYAKRVLRSYASAVKACVTRRQPRDVIRIARSVLSPERELTYSE